MQYWPIFLLANGEHVGCCGLKPRDPRQRIYELGAHIRSQHWRQGLAEEAAGAIIAHAFDELGASGLFAGHHPENEASRRLLAKLGFVYTHDELYPPTGLHHPSYHLHRTRPAPNLDRTRDSADSFGRSTMATRGTGRVRAGAAMTEYQLEKYKQFYEDWAKLREDPLEADYIFQIGKWKWEHLRPLIARHGVPESVLEFGCGSGDMLEMARSSFPAAKLYGIDLSERMIAMARERLGERHARLRIG